MANFAPFIDRKKTLTEEEFYPDPRKTSAETDIDIEGQIKFFSQLLGCGPDKPGTAMKR